MDNEYIPISEAARRTGYTYRWCLELARRNIIPSRLRFGRPEIDITALLDYRARTQALGPAKHALRYPAPEVVDAPGAA